MSMTTLEILNKAQDLIRNPDHWTQGEYARAATGRPVDATDPDAVCFCSYGAIYNVAPGERFYPAVDYLFRAVDEVEKHCGIGAFNDTHTHEEVMKVWDRAKELASR